MLSGVKDTLYIPLYARIYASKKFPEFFYDQKALELEKFIKMESEGIQKSSEYSLLASVARYYYFDKIVEDFINKNPQGNIINLGCGLDTLCERSGNKTATFYAVDFPETISVREKILKPNGNETLIASDIKSDEWINKVDLKKPTLAILSGVFQYFHEDEVLAFIKKLQEKFANIEIAFDATNKTGISYANKYVKKTGNKNAMMYFYVNDPQVFSKKCGAILLKTNTFFVEMRRALKHKLRFMTRLFMAVVDKKKRAIIVYLKLK